MNEEDLAVRDFLLKHPEATVFHGPLYRVVDGQIMKGMYVVAHVQVGVGADGKSWESVGLSVEEALDSVEAQMRRQPGRGITVSALKVAIEKQHQTADEPS